MPEENSLQMDTEKLEKPKESSKVTLWANLEPKYQLFAIMFAEHGSFVECAEHFDLSTGTMRAWSRRPAVAALINHTLEKFKNHSLVNRQLIERSALEILDMAMGHEESKGVDKDGATWEEKVTNLPAATQALALIQRIDNETETRKIKSLDKNSGGTVIVNIENANFDSNQHAALMSNQGSIVSEQ
jgi:hypothetical protein